MLEAELLAELQYRLPNRQLTFAEPPARLGGGYLTENLRFRLTGAPEPWDKPLVVRLFPASLPDDLAVREAAVQSMLASHGFPAPEVLLFDPASRLDGRRFFVMELLPGHALMGGASVLDLMRAGWTLLVRLAEVTASLHARLHRIDPSPLLGELDDAAIGLRRWFDALGANIDVGATGFVVARQWLVDNVPASDRLALCHGDTWGGNILVSGRQVTGLIDWTVATVADPVLDLGFTTMSLSLVPITAPRPVQRALAAMGRRVARRYLVAYRRASGVVPIDPTALRYYEALRTAVELSFVARYRLSEAAGVSPDVPRPTWSAIVDDMVDFFRARTGVTIELPTVPAGT